MKLTSLLLLLCCGLAVHSQNFNNEWIDYNKTYYKFKLGADGLCRINQPALAALNLQTVQAQHFQLWRNGQEIPLYTSVATGVFGAGDYIEFWGQRNDGKPDLDLYRNPDFQLNNKHSLETDTSTYFLTVNTTTPNRRLENTPNIIPGSPTPDPYFMYTKGKYWQDRLNAGFSQREGDNTFSSAYEGNEGWTALNIEKYQPAVPTNNVLTYVMNDLHVYTGAGSPDASFKVHGSGNTYNVSDVGIYYPRTFVAKINNQTLVEQEVPLFDYFKETRPVPLSLINTSVATISLINNSTIPNPLADRISIAMVELNYPREFNFDGLPTFTFSLPASASNYLQITNFNFGIVPPVLYDLTNGKRYVADISTPGTVKVQMLPSATERQLVLVSEQALHITNISNIQVRNFVNYGIAANQGNYLIITHPYFLDGPGGSHPVDAYKAYRSSAAGGGYNTKIYMIDQLIDQFAFGIKQHPLSVRNFIRWARATYSSPLKNILLIGRGLNYIQNRNNENGADINKLSFIPTFGQPASDVLLSAEPSAPDETPLTPICRLSVVQPEEITIYLSKVIQYELQQVFSSPRIEDKAWMKNFVHVVGASEPFLVSILEGAMDNYKQIASDTLIGAKVQTFSKSSVDIIQQLSSQQLQSLFREGVGMLTYFGHANATALEYNLDDPSQYDNQNKYPVFLLLGCNAGNFFNYNPARLQVKETISEKYLLAENRGAIACIAGTSLGVVNGLDTYASSMYTAMGKTHYGKTVGEIMQETIRQMFIYYSPESHLARIHCEQTLLHGDPAVKMDVSFQKPDYVIEDQLVTVLPSFVSIADTQFVVKAKFLNIGKAINRDIAVEIKRTFPSGSQQVILRDTVPGTRYIDSLEFKVKILPSEKGLNKITITVEADQVIDELYETNNTITKDIFIYEDEIRPVSPFAYAIVNTQPIKLYASTANPFSLQRNYLFELDTTELFNSPLKVARTVSSVGGLLEFDPGVVFTDSTVYYWRVAPAPTTGLPNWNLSSFIYLPGSDPGFNQSHYFQHNRSEKDNILINPGHSWKFDSSDHFLTGRNGVFGSATGQEGDLVVKPDGDAYIRSACVPSSLIFVIFNPNTFVPQKNTGQYNSPLPCLTPGREWNYEWSFTTKGERKKMMDFMDSIPDGWIVVVRNITTNPFTGPFINQWQDDTLDFGHNNSLYHKLKDVGFNALDSFYRSRALVFIYQKNRPGFGPVSRASNDIFDVIELTKYLKTPDSLAYVKSPVFGRAKAWKGLKWRGSSPDVKSGDLPLVDVLGVSATGQETLVAANLNVGTQDYDLSSINAGQYPYLRLRMRNADSVNFTPYQLRYWRITYDPVPEGAIAPNIFLQTKDTVDLGEPIEFKVAFRNVTPVAFDSMRVKMVITDKDNRQHTIPITKRRKLLGNPDTLLVGGRIETPGLTGTNTLFIEVNQDEDQPEQFHYNNFAYRTLVVRADTLNPLMDVTFDGVHILNRDIVSSRPEILIKLKDEARWMLLDTNSLAKVTIKYPDGSSRTFPYNNDTLRFIPPGGQAPSTDNTATINFKPFFTEDGVYELIVSGKDKSNNNSGVVDYRVQFEVINKPMISNMLNYPNPFTTSTAFVFTITGSEVPQNIRIQIMTITGKIVRDITKAELGPLHIGRNITEFKWDGTDQYGSKLANGIYLYRVITNLNGKKLDKYRSEGEDTDKYFKEGYGKMYLMR
jgi:hypothetical protein